MKKLAIALMLAATPAHAHHEILVATSLLPTAGGLSIILVAGMVALRRKFREIRAKRKKIEA